MNTINVSLPFVHPLSLLGAYAINIRIPTQASVCLFVCVFVFVCMCLHCLSDQTFKTIRQPPFPLSPTRSCSFTTLLFPRGRRSLSSCVLVFASFLLSIGAFLTSRLFFRVISPSSSTLTPLTHSLFRPSSYCCSVQQQEPYLNQSTNLSFFFPPTFFLFDNLFFSTTSISPISR